MCDGPVLNTSEIGRLFKFSQLLGNDYSGRWLLNGTVFEIEIVDSTGADSSDIPHAGPPYVGGFVVEPITTQGRRIRSADGKSLPSDVMSPVLEGDFGPERIQVVSVTASDPDEGNPAYDAGDAVVVRFSERTNKGELPDKKISKAAIDNLLRFNLVLGADYQGDWITCELLRITILDSSQSPPPLPLHNITVTVLPSGNLRNWPPASSPSTHAFTGILQGSFGPEAISVVELVAQDGGKGTGTYDVNDTITLVLSEPTDRGGLPEHVSFEQINAILSFNQNLGSHYTGRWTDNGVFTSPMGPGFYPDIPYSSTLVITIHDTTGASPPTIDTLRATFRPAALVRNVPPVCSPASSTSPALSADFGPTNISIVGLSARGDLNCGPAAAAAACDSVYGNGDVIDIEFSEDVTLCMESCACTNASASPADCARPLDLSVPQRLLNASLAWSAHLGAGYVGEWRSRSVLRITVVNATGASPPELYALVVRVTAAAGLRNFPPTGRRSLPQSNGLCMTKRERLDLDCGLGAADVVVDRVVAAASAAGLEDQERLGRLSKGDTITVVFNQPTSMGMPMLCVGGMWHGHACQNGITCQDYIYNAKLQTREYLSTGGVCTASPLRLLQRLPKPTVYSLSACIHIQ